ncbi:MAG: glycosyltransferase, partial [Chloroflexi bacterium]|nr:glycosyltransferase [Chloroflexota bacterium]
MTAPPGDANGLIRGRLRSWVATAPGERIALVMIVRDEASNLERCLASAVPWVDEMVVVDTGSADATVEIAESFGARVGHFAWCDDFAG